jgi:hypothetical protein
MQSIKISEFSLTLFASVAMVLGGVLIATGAALPAYSQSLLAGDISGTVLDPSGSVVTGATVTAKNKATEATESVKTDAQSAYRFALLKPGAYIVSVKADGFKEESAEVVVSLGQVATVPLHLNVGSEAETVEVSETTQLLQPDSAELPRSALTNCRACQISVAILCGANCAGRGNEHWGGFRQLLSVWPAGNFEQLHHEWNAGQRSFSEFEQLRSFESAPRSEASS